MNKESLTNDMKELMYGTNSKVYGDPMIGYRLQDSNGNYIDDLLGDLYEDYADLDCDIWNEVCEELKSGCHTW